MMWMYLAATIFGCAFLIPMVLGGLDSDIDAGDGFGGDVGDTDLSGGIDVDTELDADTGGPVDGGSGGLFDGAIGSVFASLVSLRTLVFFSAFFGTSGLVFSALGYSWAATLVTALLLGVIAAGTNSVLFGLIRNSQPNSQISDRTLEGRPAKVVLPMDGSTRGRIRVDLSGQPHYLVARPMDGVHERFDVGASVVVVKIEQGTAHVASLAELETGEES